MKNIALILASGAGSRFGGNCPKQFVRIGDKCILQHTVFAFQSHQDIDEIILVTNREYVEEVKDLTCGFSKVKKVISGGETRKDSSYNGIMSIEGEECNVLIHDGVRPLVSKKIIDDCIVALKTREAVCVAIDTTDTIYVVSDKDEILDVPTRKYLRRAQTPQGFRLSLIKKAHLLAKDDKNCLVTDDCGLIMHYKLSEVYTVKGEETNIKITYPEDIEFAQKRLCGS